MKEESTDRIQKNRLTSPTTLSLLKKDPNDRIPTAQAVDRIPTAQAVSEEINRPFSIPDQLKLDTSKTAPIPAPLPMPKRNLFPSVAIGIAAIIVIGGLSHFLYTVLGGTGTTNTINTTANRISEREMPEVPHPAVDVPLAMHPAIDTAIGTAIDIISPVRKPAPPNHLLVVPKEGAPADKRRAGQKLIVKQQAEKELKALAAKEKADQERLAKEQEAQQKELAEKQKIAEAKLASALIESGKLERARDRETFNEALANFKAGYESRDLQRLKQITGMSENKAGFLRQIFSAYQTIEVEISNRSQTDDGQSASAVVTITKLIDKNNNLVVPGEQWKKANLRLQKEGDSWGKIIW